uniref:Transmembrane protein 183 n=1 Tax=Plectus sambesii TaxID=2011161 RepID=A0A914WXZ4_9BILA
MTSVSRKEFGMVDSDVCLSDFANTGIKSGKYRISKARLTKNWYDCDLNDFDDQLVEDECEKEESLPTTNKQRKKAKKRRTGREKDEDNEDLRRVSGSSYPSDMWWLLAEYISAEDIGRFAGICRATNYIVETAAFWKLVYNRYYVSTPNLPDRFKPSGISRQYGLRTCTIKSLFYFYPPFVNRLISLSPICLKTRAVNKLLKSICTDVWFEQKTVDSTQSTPLFVFYFAFTHGPSRQQMITTTTAYAANSTDKLQYLDNIWAHLADGCTVLKVETSRFMRIPFALVGSRINKVTLSLMSDMRSHSLRLEFVEPKGRCAGPKGESVSLGAVTLIQLDMVDKAQLLDWFHPDYPLPVV